MDDFDPLRRQRIDGDGVVGGGVGDVDRADAVGEHAHALAREAAQDGPRRAGAEGGGGNAGEPGQGIADLRLQVPDQLRAGQHRLARQQVDVLDRMAGDDDRRRRVIMDVIGLRRRLRARDGLGRRLRRLREGGHGGKSRGGEQKRELYHVRLQEVRPA